MWLRERRLAERKGWNITYAYNGCVMLHQLAPNRATFTLIKKHFFVFIKQPNLFRNQLEERVRPKCFPGWINCCFNFFASQDWIGFDKNIFF